MTSHTIHDKTFDIFLKEDKIRERISELAAEIHANMQGKYPHFIAVLDGSFIFAADLLKSYPGNCKISFVKLKSYEGDMSSGKVNEIIGLNEIDQNETIVVIEDIVDTGTTLSKISDILEVMNRPWLIVSLFFKPQAFIGTRKIDFVGFQIPNNFIVGYGLDYNGFGRNLKNIYQLAKA